MLTFNAERHEYRWNDAVVPSVTQILKPLVDFSMVAPDVLEHARQRGVAVHKCVQLDIKDDLLEESVVPEIAGYLAAWRRFRTEGQIKSADFGAPELPLYHPTLHFAGTPDVPLFFGGRWSVLDIKTAEAMGATWALQTAAYRELLNVNTTKGEHLIEDRYSLRLRADGTYRLDQYKDRVDWGVFLSALTLTNWKRKNT